MASELDYAEQTSWLLFLKYLNDLEVERQDTDELEGRDYRPILDDRYRWDAWAAPKTDGKLDHNAAITGEDLIEVVNRDLFPHLEWPAPIDGWCISSRRTRRMEQSPSTR